MEQPLVSPAGRSRRVFFGIRLDPDVANTIRQIAAREHIPATALARSYLTKQLSTELARQERTSDSALDVMN